MDNALAYHPGDTPVHTLDARVKILLVLACSIALLAVNEWWSLAVLAAVIVGTAVLGKVPLARAARGLAPVALILVFTLVAPAISLEDGQVAFQVQGLASGAFYTMRIVLLLAGSIVLTATTSPEGLLAALRRLLAPLERFGLPAYDIATSAQIALRFMPLIAEQINAVSRAHEARGARLASGGAISRVRAWGRVLTPVFVGLFRRAATLATALDARCYGAASSSRNKLQPLTAGQWCVMCAGIVLCAVLAYWG